MGLQYICPSVFKVSRLIDDNKMAKIMGMTIKLITKIMTAMKTLSITATAAAATIASSMLTRRPLRMKTIPTTKRQRFIQ